MLELLAVIALVAVLGGLALGTGQRAMDRARIARTQAELAAISAALDAYKRAYGDFPRTDDETQMLRALLGRRGPVSDAPINGRALLETARMTIRDDVIVDPWSRPYVYVYRTPAGGWTNPGFVLYSGGPDQSENPRLLAGGFPDAAPKENEDNIHASR